MTPEAQKPSELKSTLITTAIIGGIFLLSEFAFSGRIRDEAIGRAGNKSEISGVKPAGIALHVMHLDHTKDETYNTVERALVVTPKEHLIYHRVHKGKADKIGMTESENDGAINLLASIIHKLGIK